MAPDEKRVTDTDVDHEPDPAGAEPEEKDVSPEADILAEKEGAAGNVVRSPRPNSLSLEDEPGEPARGAAIPAEQVPHGVAQIGVKKGPDQLGDDAPSARDERQARVESDATEKARAEEAKRDRAEARAAAREVEAEKDAKTKTKSSTSSTAKKDKG